MAKAAKTKETAAQSGAAVDTAKPKASDKKVAAKKIADELGVDTLFENSIGEYFTDHNRALLSVAGNGKAVVTHKFATADAVADLVEQVKDAIVSGGTEADKDISEGADNPNRHVITEQDLLDYPELKEKGLGIGDTIETLPVNKPTADQSN